MASYIAAADGNLSDAATWGTVDSTSLLDSETNSQALTTSYVESQTFAPGALTIDGIAVKIATRAATPTGTISVRLAQAGSTVTGTEVTINVSDVPTVGGTATNAKAEGWYFFKFAAPVLLLAATNYTVSAKTSSSSQINLWRNSTTANWSRMLRTTTTGAPGAGDNFHVLGEWTAAATKTTRTVTMNSTSATDFGNGTSISTSNPPGVTVGNGGVLTSAVAGSTAYILQLSTTLRVYAGGTLTLGEFGAEIPRTSTLDVQFDCASDGQFGLEIYGTGKSGGLSRTSGKNVVQALLTADASSGGTSLTLSEDTGWKSGDDVAIASTTRTATQCETVAASGDATATTIAVGATANAHSGTAPTQAEVILLTRNVRIESVSSSNMAYVFVGYSGTVDFRWTAFRYLGSALSPTQGIEILSQQTVNFDYCSFRDFEQNGVRMTPADAHAYTLTNCVWYCAGSNADAAFYYVPTAVGFLTLTDCTTIRSQATSSAYGFNIQDAQCTLQRLRAAGGSIGMRLISLSAAQGGVWSDWVMHSTQSNAILLSSTGNYGANTWRVENVDCWRAANSGGLALINFQGGVLTLVNWRLFGSNTENVALGQGNSAAVVFRDCTIAGDSSFATTTGVTWTTSGMGPWEIRFENCLLSPTSGIFVPHTTDLDFSSGIMPGFLTLVSTTLSAATPIAGKTRFIGRAAIRYQNAAGAAGANSMEYPQLGTVARDATTYHTAAPSEKLTPSGATPFFRLRSGVRRKAVQSGQTPSVACYVRKDSSYTGSAPRVLLLANLAIGVDDDVVLATHSAAADVWQFLSAVLPEATDDGVYEIVVEVDGSAGNVWTDDWS